MESTIDAMTWTTERPTGRILRRLIATDADWTATVARVALGLVMLPHGLQKTLGWFGGYGFEGTMGFLTGAGGLPTAVALLVILAESAGSIGLIVGALGRVAAAGIGAVMVGAVATVHWTNGFFMNWTGAQGVPAAVTGAHGGPPGAGPGGIGIRQERRRRGSYFVELLPLEAELFVDVVVLGELSFEDEVEVAVSALAEDSFPPSFPPSFPAWPLRA